MFLNSVVPVALPLFSSLLFIYLNSTLPADQDSQAGDDERFPDPMLKVPQIGELCSLIMLFRYIPIPQIIFLTMNLLSDIFSGLLLYGFE